MGDTSPQPVTQLLDAVRAGQPEAAAALLERVYGELRKIAHRQMAHMPPGDTLQPTALVHEAYLRLFGKGELSWEDRAHFFKAAARAMRDVLVEEARKHASLKRGGGRKRVPLEMTIASPDTCALELVALDEALTKLEECDRTTAEVVMLRHFAGLTVPETARALGISRATADRHWRFARAWLRHRLEDDAPEAVEGMSEHET
ncbi:MAG: sigma-70 family RNA polymerase sigma factor [Planctomycetota bacterium]|jgi:RNA polymerase sigma factor (TIGR02999 family)